MEQKRNAARHERTEQQREDQDQPPEIADAFLERPLSRQAMDLSDGDENNPSLASGELRRRLAGRSAEADRPASTASRIASRPDRGGGGQGPRRI
jgi:hypothetical protein